LIQIVSLVTVQSYDLFDDLFYDLFDDLFYVREMTEKWF